MKDFERRIKALEYTIGIKEAEKRAHEPFVVYQPWSIVLDEYYVTYHPEGKYKKPVEYGPLSYADTCKLLSQYPGKLLCQITMGECSEWLYAFHYFSCHSKNYTQEQKERFLKKDLEDNPELAYMLTDEGVKMTHTLLKLPQVFFVWMKDLQKAIKGV